MISAQSLSFLPDWLGDETAFFLKKAAKVNFFLGGGCASSWCTAMQGCCGVLLLAGTGRDISSATAFFDLVWFNVGCAEPWVNQ